MQTATDGSRVVTGEGTQSEEDRGGDNADSGGAGRPESEHLQQSIISAFSSVSFKRAK